MSSAREVLQPLRALLWLSIACLPLQAFAHSQSTALVQVDSSGNAVAGGTVQIDIALVDLHHVLDLDADGDGSITWAELEGRTADIFEFVRGGVTLTAGDPEQSCDFESPELLVDDHADGPYAVTRFEVPCLAADRDVTLHYGLLFDVDASHRALVSRISRDGRVDSLVLTNGEREHRWPSAGRGFWAGFDGWFRQGVWHIWTGYDHLLFLATLLLPALVQRRQSRWVAQASLPTALKDVFQVVTAFTVAHSLTLLAGTLGWVAPDTRWVESAIALTVLLGALNLLFPVVDRRRWLVALVFGLIHGLGFAALLSDLHLGRAHLLRDLFAFNAGVEIGQLAVVAVFVPVAFALRQQRWYREAFTPAAACAIALLAAVWLFQRVTGVE